MTDNPLEVSLRSAPSVTILVFAPQWRNTLGSLYTNVCTLLNLSLRSVLVNMSRYLVEVSEVHELPCKKQQWTTMYFPVRTEAACSINVSLL